VRGDDVCSRLRELTERQWSVLRLAIKGYQAKRIANELKLSCRTVESHKFALMETLGVHSVLDLRNVVRGYVQDEF
jgi:DNA-binding NarL/FixJ family response regulator